MAKVGGFELIVRGDRTYLEDNSDHFAAPDPPKEGVGPTPQGVRPFQHRRCSPVSTPKVFARFNTEGVRQFQPRASPWDLAKHHDPSTPKVFASSSPAATPWDHTTFPNGINTEGVGQSIVGTLLKSHAKDQART